MIRHIVMWELNNPSDADGFKTQLDSCQNLVPGIIAWEVRLRTSGLEANCDVVLNSLFSDLDALNAYQIHPHHQLVSQALALLRIKRHAMDYEV